MKTRTYNNLLFFILFIIAISAGLFFVGNMKLNEYSRLEKEREESIKISLENLPILAKAVSVYNINKYKKIYGKNDEMIFPIASLAKILTVTQSLNTHKVDEIISVSPEAIDQAGDFGIFANEKWNIDDIARFTLIASANDGAYALAEGDEDFVNKLNMKAKKIGAENTLFINSTGLDLSLEEAGLPAQAGAFGTAFDINIMAMYALKARPEVFSVTTLPEINLTSVSGFEHNFENTNILIGKIPNLLFSKTGYTEIAGGNLVIIFKNERGEEIAVTLLGSTFEGRFQDMEKIVNVLYDV